jgi:hypothetical protein
MEPLCVHDSMNQTTFYWEYAGDLVWAAAGENGDVSVDRCLVEVVSVVSRVPVQPNSFVAE